MKTILLFLSFLGLTLNGFAQYYYSIESLPKRIGDKYRYKYLHEAEYDDCKLVMGKDVLWVDSSFVCIQADPGSDLANFYIGSLPLMINGKVTTNSTRLAKTISECLLNKEFCDYISSLTRQDVTQISLFWIHIKGDLDIPVQLWNILHPNTNEKYKNETVPEIHGRYDMPPFVAFDMNTVLYKEKIGDSFCFVLSAGDDSWGIMRFDSYRDLVTTCETAYGHWMEEIDEPIIDDWFNMLPFPSIPKDLKQKVIGILEEHKFRSEIFYY